MLKTTEFDIHVPLLVRFTQICGTGSAYLSETSDITTVFVDLVMLSIQYFMLYFVQC